MNKDERDLRDTVDPVRLASIFFVGAPPRSGNTYLRYALGDAYTKSYRDAGEFFTHDHSSAYALIHLSEEPKTFPIFVSPIRDPYDTLKSKLVRTYQEWGTEPKVVEYIPSIDDLCFYWEVLLVDPSRFCLVDFNELVSNKDSVLDKIDKKYPEVRQYRGDTLATNEELLEFLRLEDMAEYKDDNKLFLSSGHIPRESSEYSEMAEKLLDTPAYARRLSYLYELYSELLKLTI